MHASRPRPVNGGFDHRWWIYCSKWIVGVCYQEDTNSHSLCFGWCRSFFQVFWRWANRWISRVYWDCYTPSEYLDRRRMRNDNLKVSHHAMMMIIISKRGLPSRPHQMQHNMELESTQHLLRRPKTSLSGSPETQPQNPGQQTPVVSSLLILGKINSFLLETKNASSRSMPPLLVCRGDRASCCSSTRCFQKRHGRRFPLASNARKNAQWWVCFQLRTVGYILADWSVDRIDPFRERIHGVKRGLIRLFSEKQANASVFVRQYSLPHLQTLQIVHNVWLRWS